MFVTRHDFLEKFLIDYQIVYLEQTYIRLLNLADNHYWQYYRELILLSVMSRCGTFSPVLFLVILFPVLSSNFIISDVKAHDNILF